MYVGIKTGAEYTRAVRDRLADDGEELDTSDFDRRDLLTVTLTRLDLANELAKVGVTLDGDAPETGPDLAVGDGGTTLDRILASDPAVVERALDECDDWDETHIEALARLLTRTDFYSRAVRALLSIGEPSVRHVIDVLLDEHADFVIRRRIPRILAEVNTAAADQALLDGLAAGRFEVRYRAAIALSRRRKAGLVTAQGDWQSIVWQAVAREVSRDRPIWELQKILDEAEAGGDDFVGKRVEVRGELSLEHTFRQLSLVLDAEAVKMAFHGIVMGDENLKSLALEYLEQILPPDIRDRLWPFIGDISDYQRGKSIRSVDEVVHDLSQTGVTLFGGAADRAALHDALRTHESRQKDEDADD
ncbi:MAG: HEAT repeat domain-containing protein [Acidobacteria bacterium]|nr:HEAT repeat domain-containing protein [Acidobacteriota bacterium]